MTQTDPFGVSKAYNFRDPSQNRRRHNALYGAGIDAGLGGAAGAVFGGRRGARAARSGIGALQSVGAGPSRARSAGIVAGHTARAAGKGALPLAALGGVVGAYAGATSLPAKRRVAKSDTEDEMTQTDPFGVSKAYNWKDTKKNPRRKNVAAGTVVGAGMYAGLGAAGGAHTGARQARRGLTVLQGMGAKPSAPRSLGIAVSHAARGGRRGAAILAPIGAVAGAAGGALSPAKRKHRATVRKSAFGVEVPDELGKAFGDTPSRAQVNRLSPAGQKAYRGSRGTAYAGIGGGLGAAALGASVERAGEKGTHRALRSNSGKLVRHQRVAGAGGRLVGAGRAGQWVGIGAAGVAAGLGSRAKHKQVRKSAFGVEYGQ